MDARRPGGETRDIRGVLGGRERMAALARSRIGECEGHAALQALATAAARGLGVAAAYVAALERGGVRVLAASGDDAIVAGGMRPPGASLHLLEPDGRVAIVDGRTDLRARRRDLALHGFVACLVEPARWAGEIVGGLCVLDTVPRAWTRPERALLRALADAVEEVVRGEAARLAAAHSRHTALENERLGQRERLTMERCMHALPIGLAVVEPQRGVVALNDRFATMLGCARDDLLGFPPAEVLPAALVRQVTAVAADGRRRDRRLGRAAAIATMACCFVLEAPAEPPLHAVSTERRVGVALVPARGWRRYASPIVG